MDRTAAEQIVSMLVRGADEIAGTIHVFKIHGPEDQRKAYSDAVGRVMFAIDGLLRPILHEYPDLHP